MRQAETKFLELLGNLPKTELLSAGRFTGYEEENKAMENFSNTITYMVNSFSFSRKEVFDVIMNKKKLSDSFVILSLHYIKQCSDKWKSNYWDDRDRASANMCREIVRCPEFSDFNERNCQKETGKWKLCAEEGGWHKNMLLGVKLIHSIYNMHPKIRGA